ncbi:hypothetical protein [Haladaptatus caseinilyticus]|nr:hypothetical protein [Haladaptatus caseinilyticus]
MSEQQKSSRPRLGPDVTRRLDIYRASHGLANSNDAIADLLDRIEECDK